MQRFHYANESKKLQRCDDGVGNGRNDNLGTKETLVSKQYHLYNRSGNELV
jgi:hypothetical protein